MEKTQDEKIEDFIEQRLSIYSDVVGDIRVFDRFVHIEIVAETVSANIINWLVADGFELNRIMHEKGIFKVSMTIPSIVRGL